MTSGLWAFRYESMAARWTNSLEPRTETNRREVKVLKLDKTVLSTPSTFSAFSALFLSGCMVGPKYHGPPPETTADLPTKYKHGSTQNGHWKIPEPRDTEGAGDWWQIYSDPTLDRLENQAVAGNQNLRLSIDRIDDARAQMRIAAADLYPNLALSWSGTKARTTSTGPVQSARIVGTTSSLGGGGSSSGPMPVFEGFRLRAGVESAKAQYRETVENYRSQVLGAFQDVENALVDLRTLVGQWEAQQRAVEAAQRTFDLSRQQYDKGAVTYLDVLDAERTLLSDQEVSAQLSGARLQASVQLIKAFGGRWGREYDQPKVPAMVFVGRSKSG
jgi:outer membrane protein TolC